LTGTANADTISGAGGQDTLLGLAGNDSIMGGSGNDSVDGGAGNDTIESGAGNDVVVGGLGADKIDLGAGTDVVKLVDVSDSSSTAADTVAGFASGDKIDLSTLLGALGVGYTSENAIPAGSSSSPFTLSGMAVSNGVATVDVIYNGTDLIGEGSISIDFMVPSGSQLIDVTNKANWKAVDFNPDTGLVGGVTTTTLATQTALAKGATFITASFSVATNATSFVFAVDSASVNNSSVSAPLTKLFGTTSTAQTGAYSIIDDGSSIVSTVGDNEIHFANNSTTGGVDIRFDSNKAAGTTTQSSLVHLDGIIGIDLTKTDFVLV